MAESADYDPGPWSGYDFKSLRAKYDVHVGRSYDDAKAKSYKKPDLVPDQLETQSESPLILVLDETGSMGDWPATIFSKLPYLDLEGKEYLGDSMEVCFCAVGDVFSDQYPLQVRPFCSGKDMEPTLQKLIIEGNGGGQACESYDIAGMYFARNVKMPKAITPILIFVGDEGLYSVVDKAKAEEWAGVKLEKTLTVEELFEELKAKYRVYVIRKPYGSSADGSGCSIHQQWVRILGEDHVVMLPEASRVVDVIFGILAKETGRIDYFKKELKDRQGKDADGDKKIGVVLKSLHTVHAPVAAATDKRAARSITRAKKSGDGKKSISLLGD